MPCTHFAGAIVCTRGRSKRCRFCHLAGGYQCDWKVGGKRKSCDAHLCPEHATLIAHDKHVCPTHRPAFEAWLAREILKEKAR